MIQVCSFCVMDETDPEISFTDDGRCNHCTDAEVRLAGLGSLAQKNQVLMARINAIKERNKRANYDVVMGVSGGVDSSYALCVAKDLGLRVLAVHCDTGWNSDIAVSNIHKLISKLGFDLETFVVDWGTMRALQRSFFQASLSNCDIPQDHAIVSVNSIIARRLGIRDFISGGNLVGESIMPSSWGYDARDLTHIKAVNRRFENISLKHFPKMSFLESYFMTPYIRGVRNFRLLNFIDYNPIEAKKYLIENLDWRDYGGKHHESVFTRFYQAYYLPEKFKFDKRKGHLSSLIVAGLITRKAALEELDKPLYDDSSLRRDAFYFREKLGFSEAEWEEIMTMRPCSHFDYPTHSFLHSRLTKLKNFLEGRGVILRRSW